MLFEESHGGRRREEPCKHDGRNVAHEEPHSQDGYQSLTISKSFRFHFTSENFILPR